VIAVFLRENLQASAVPDHLRKVFPIADNAPIYTTAMSIRSASLLII
jgi:hypothetical protein